MIYITGDTHGEVSRFEEVHEQYRLTDKDKLIVAGDFGCIFGLGLHDEQKLDTLAKLPYTILFIDGNHECFPQIFSYPEEMWNGGRAHRIRPNILHLMRGQVFDIEDTSIFTMGGGYSIDVAFRIPGRSWWPEELPTEEEYEEALRNLAAHGNRVDVIISHAAPEETMQMFVQTGVISHRYLQEGRLNTFLENVRQTVDHRHYYFGHMHIDKQLFRNQTALYYDVYRLEDGRKAMRRDTVGELPPEAEWGETGDKKNWTSGERT